MFALTACNTNSGTVDNTTELQNIDNTSSTDTTENSMISEIENYIPSTEYDNVYPQHEPYGTGIDAMPGRVVWAHNTDSVNWDGNGYWWNPDNFDETIILEMVNDSIASR